VDQVLSDRTVINDIPAFLENSGLKWLFLCTLLPKSVNDRH
jgi:hypothetical protein